MCLHWGVSLPPLPIPFSLRGCHYTWPTLKRGFWAPFPEGRAYTYIYMTQNASTQMCLFSSFTYSLFFPISISPLVSVLYFGLYSNTVSLILLLQASQPCLFLSEQLLGPFNTPSLQAVYFEYCIPFWHYKMLNTFDFDINRATFHFYN